MNGPHLYFIKDCQDGYRIHGCNQRSKEHGFQKARIGASWILKSCFRIIKLSRILHSRAVISIIEEPCLANQEQGAAWVD